MLYQRNPPAPRSRHDLGHTPPDPRWRNVTDVTTAHVTGLDEVGATLLTAASRLLADEGPASLTVRRIAADAGVSTMNVYSRFGGKLGVVEHLFLQGFGLLADAMAAVPRTDRPDDDLRRCGDAYRVFALSHPTLYSVMFDRVMADYEPSEAAMAVAFHTLDHLAQRIQRCIDAGLFREGPALHFAAIVWSTCHGVVILELRRKMDDIVAWDVVYRDACDNVVRGLRR